MLKNIAIFLIGGVVGAAVLYGIATGVVSQFRGENGTPPVSPTPQSQNPQETPEVVQRFNRDQIEKLRSQLFEEGIEITAKVDKVFPDTGFIIEDNAGVKLFARWKETAPSEGQSISIKGTIKRFSNETEGFKNEPGFTGELENFLKDQTIFIETQEVNNPR